MRRARTGVVEKAAERDAAENRREHDRERVRVALEIQHEHAEPHDFERDRDEPGDDEDAEHRPAAPVTVKFRRSQDAETSRDRVWTGSVARREATIAIAPTTTLARAAIRNDEMMP